MENISSKYPGEVLRECLEFSIMIAILLESLDVANMLTGVNSLKMNPRLSIN